MSPWTPPADPAVLSVFLGDLGPWLATEYAGVDDSKTPWM
jgi:hypothetical protein